MKDVDVQLPEKAIKEMEHLIAEFKGKAIKELESALSEVYTEIGIHADTDSWSNFREQLRTALAHDRAWAEEDNYWAQAVRRRILNDHQEELVTLINGDLVRRIKDLEEQIERIHRNRSIY